MTPAWAEFCSPRSGHRHSNESHEELEYHLGDLVEGPSPLEALVQAVVRTAGLVGVILAPLKVPLVIKGNFDSVPVVRHIGVLQRATRFIAPNGVRDCDGERERE